MSMRAPTLAICGNEDCANNANGKQTLVCSSCACCANCRLHTDCDDAATVHGKEP
jgi:hypothetical protein